MTPINRTTLIYTDSLTLDCKSSRQSIIGLQIQPTVYHRTACCRVPIRKELRAMAALLSRSQAFIAIHIKMVTAISLLFFFPPSSRPSFLRLFLPSFFPSYLLFFLAFFHPSCFSLPSSFLFLLSPLFISPCKYFFFLFSSLSLHS